MTTFADKSQQRALITKLQGITLFNRCSGTHLQIMLKAAKLMPLELDQVLCEQGTPPSGVYILMKGGLAVVRDGVEIDRLEPISTAGEVSMLTATPHEEQVVALSPGLALHIPYKLFEVLLAKDPDLYQRICRNVIVELAAQLQRANQAQSSVAGRRAEMARRLKEARFELNDARMLRSMRGDDE